MKFKTIAMRTIMLFLALFLLVFNADAQKEKTNVKTAAIHEVETSDSISYEVVIIDPGFESWMQTQAKSMSHYSLSYLENWNNQYVKEWNYRYQMGKNSRIIESFIDYNPNTDYGLEVNYMLYSYFVYVERKLHLKLLNRSVY